MKENCKYCGGNCPNDRGDNLCDGFAGDIDGLYTNASETKSPAMVRALDELSLKSFGRARSVAKAGESCVTCGGRADKFTGEISKREFGISGMCQTCQDKTYG
jgi:hypothetical protein